MPAYIATVRSDVHSAFRIVLLIDENMAAPMSRDEVTSEAIFKGFRIVQVIINVNPVTSAGPLRPASVVIIVILVGQSFIAGVEVVPIITGVHYIGDVIFTDKFCLFYCIDAFTDNQFFHDVRNFVP